MKFHYLALILALLQTGCGSDSGLSNSDIIIDTITPDAPAGYAQYTNILSNSSLQRSNPLQEDGNKSNVANSSQLLSGYFDDYFFVDSHTGNLTFNMSGYKNRSEIRVNQNFDTAEQSVDRTLNTRFQPIDIKSTLESAVSGDEVTFIQVHNKGTDQNGTGYIPHPLLRITYELERDGKYGHYWAVIKLINSMGY